MEKNKKTMQICMLTECIKNNKFINTLVYKYMEAKGMENYNQVAKRKQREREKKLVLERMKAIPKDAVLCNA